MISINLFQAGLIDMKISFPETWNELELPELHAIANVMLSDIEDQQVAKSVILLEIIKNRAKNRYIPMSFIQRLDPEGLAVDCLQLTDFIYEKNDLSKQPYTTFLLKTDRIKLPTLIIGGYSDFNNLTVGEFEAAEIYFLQFKENPDVQYLASLAAVIYRPPKTEFIKYNAQNDEYITYDHESQARYFAKLDPQFLFTMYVWYAGCKSLLPRYFPTLYKAGTGTAGGNDLMLFTKCIHAAAGPKNGNRDQVRRSLLKALLFEMEQEAVKAEELKELYERK